MARFKSQILVGENDRKTYLMLATVTDNDVGKPVTRPVTGAPDVVVLATNGQEIYGFVETVEAGLTDGKKKCTIQVGGRANVILDGAAAVGTMIEAAANTAVSVAKAGNYGLVSVHVHVTTTAITLAASTFLSNWVVISGTGADEATVLIEKQ